MQVSVATLSAVSVRRGARRVIHHVDLDISAGTTALLGPNGAGKSTLFQTLVAEVTPEAGDVVVCGRNLSERRGRAALPMLTGYLPQNFGWWPGFTVAETLVYLGWVKGIAKRERMAEARRVAAEVELDDWLAEPMRTLSGGMVRRVGLAQALLGRPRLVLLDEPAAGLDPAQRVTLRDTVRAVAAEGRSVVLSTHMVDDLSAFCDHVVVLCDGKVRFSGTTQEFVRLGGHTGAGAGATAEAAYSAAMALTEGGNGAR
jgi:ABC-2 type transport system ATP-binding protein